jgi:hypothetical protein
LIFGGDDILVGQDTVVLKTDVNFMFNPDMITFQAYLSLENNGANITAATATYLESMNLLYLVQFELGGIGRASCLQNHKNTMNSPAICHMAGKTGNSFNLLSRWDLGAFAIIQAADADLLALPYIVVNAYKFKE